MKWTTWSGLIVLSGAAMTVFASGCSSSSSSNGDDGGNTSSGSGSSSGGSGSSSGSGSGGSSSSSGSASGSSSSSSGGSSSSGSSSSGTSSEAGTDAGSDAEGDSGTDATTHPGSDAGSDAASDAAADAAIDVETADVGSDAGHDSGGDAGLEAGTCTALASVPSSMIPAYAPPAHAAVCSMAQINAFVTACVSSTASNSACGAWGNDPANNACDACVVQTADAGVGSNTGALLFDSNNNPFALNLGGCIALADPTNGPACGMAVDLLFQCENAACDSAACLAAPAGDLQTCETASQQGACASQFATATGSCAIDFGDGGVGNTTCATSAGVIAEICGNGM